jgi:transcriptional regulator with XRE-family HTH domain
MGLMSKIDGHSEDIYAEVGRRIREVRKEAGLTLEEVASASGLTAAYIGQIERDVKKASLMTLTAIAKALEVPVAALFGRDGPLATLPCAKKVTALLSTLDAKERAVLMKALRLLAGELRKMRRRA